MSETITSLSRADIPAAKAETFCNYLARQFIKRRGFKSGTVAEARKLVSASDLVLTLDGEGPFTILCLIDRETHPGKQFDLPIAELEGIAEQCLKYSHAIGPYETEPMPIVIRVVEIGPTSPGQQERLKTIRLPELTSKCLASALAVDTVAGTVWSSSLQGQPEWRFIETMLQSPRLADGEIAHDVGVEAPPPIVPYTTFGLIGLLALIFYVELQFGIDAPASGYAPSVRTLIVFGSLQYLLTIDHGQWYRVFSGPLLHASLIHILSNGVALLVAGYALEREAGRLWFAALFVIGALGGACGSLLVNPHSLVTVGASGAIMGLLAAVLVISFRYTAGPNRTSLQMRAAQILVPSLLPSASAAATRIDYGAHIGGALVGALAAYVLCQLWQRNDGPRGFRRSAIAISCVGVLGTFAAGTAVTLRYHLWSVAAQLVPAGYLPKTDSDVRETLEKYPSDPRSHFFAALVLSGHHDWPGAERELHATLAAPMIDTLDPSFSLIVQSSLATARSQQHLPDQGK
jgi:rhomboid protease GluP